MVIYMIGFKETHRVYVGSAVSFKKRKAHHLSQLRSNKHRNSVLQRHYNKYGIESIKFEILEEVEKPEHLIECEQKWIDKFKWEDLINICPTAGNTLGRKHNLDSKRKISKNHADFSGEKNPMYGKRGKDNPNYGKRHSEQTKQKISEKLKGKKSWCEGIKRPEHSENMSGEKNPFYGKEHTAESVEKIKEGLKKDIKRKEGKN